METWKLEDLKPIPLVDNRPPPPPPPPGTPQPPPPPPPDREQRPVIKKNPPGKGGGGGGSSEDKDKDKDKDKGKDKDKDKDKGAGGEGEEDDDGGDGSIEPSGEPGEPGGDSGGEDGQVPDYDEDKDDDKGKQGGTTGEGERNISPGGGDQEATVTDVDPIDIPDGMDKRDDPAWWNGQINNAADIARKHPLSDKMREYIEKILRSINPSRTDWRTILRNLLQTASKDYKPDWTGPSISTYAGGGKYYLPNYTEEEHINIIIAVDCSGSIDDDTYSMFISEVLKIIEDIPTALCHIIYWSTDVRAYLPVDKENTQEVIERSIGQYSGGTNVNTVTRFIEEFDLFREEPPVACVYLTDGEFAEDKPDFPSNMQLIFAAPNEPTKQMLGSGGEILRIERKIKKT